MFAALQHETGSNAFGNAFWPEFKVSYRYPVAFTRGLFEPANPMLVETLALREADKRHQCLIFVDDGLLAAAPGLIREIEAYAAAHSDRMALYAAPIPAPGGEQIKVDAEALEAVRAAIHHYKVDRHSFIIAIGGGAVLDAVGYAAATAHRGCRHIRVPTTTLAQNDAGVGVKNGVNLAGVKNYSGTFAPPWAVLNDLDLLHHLTPRDRICGVSEAVKVALIRDRNFYLWLEANAEAIGRFEPATEEHMIRRCAELHLNQIAHGGDPFETGSARPLDFGHWAAHKLESLTDHAVRHGEAVAIGIALDARYSVLAGHLETGADARIADAMRRMGFELWHPALTSETLDGRLALLAGLEEFREHLGGELTVTLLSDLGVGLEVHEIDDALMASALDWLKQFGPR